MKKSASAPPVSVRFLNSCSEDPSGSGDEGLAEDRPGAAEDAAGDGMSRVAPSADPAAPAAAAPVPAPAPAGTEGQPVPPPRKHSVRSRADGLRDALQDLSPVKEFVSRLGKSRSSSLDGPGMTSAGAGAGADRPPEHKPSTSDSSDKWSRLTELTEKITKTVEEKISDYRGSTRSASGSSGTGGGTGGTGTGGGASHSEFEVLTELDVLEAVRDASPPPPPPPGSPPPSATSDLDVTFVNVQSPVAAPAASPSRRDFKLANIRPQIFERLQRSVGRPAAPPPSPPAGGSQSPPPAVPPDSVTLSALQGKYIDEEGVDVAEEALEAPPPQSPPPPLSPAGEQHARRTDSGLEWPGLPGRAAAGRTAAAVGTEPATSGGRPAAAAVAGLSGRLAAGMTGGWRWLAVVVAVLLAAPLPSFLSGFLVGAVLAAAAAAALLPLLRPPARRLPPPPTLAHTRPPVKEYRPSLMHKDWMHELLVSRYEPTSHQPTEARFVRLEGTMLRISHPKGHVAKRAACDEHIPNLPFVQQRIYDIAGCEVELRPEGLHPTRRWSRRYPLCVRLDNCRRVTRSRGLLGAGSLKATAGVDRSRSSDGEWESGWQETGLDGGTAPASEEQRAIYLFARTDRNKEHWFRLLQEATRQGQEEAEAPPSPAAEPPAAESASSSTTGLSTTESTTTTTAAAATAAAPAAAPAAGSSSDAAAGSREEAEETASPQPPPTPTQPSPKLDFDYYMSKLIPPTPEGGADSRPPSPTEGPSRAPATAAGHVVWFNALIGRLAFDVFGNRRWAAFVQNRVQRKISRIKPPFFIEELAVTSCDLGSVVPRITSVSAPSCDERGLWTDMAVLYEGGACITLRTKVNLMKLRKTDREVQQQSAEGGTDGDQSAGSAADGADPNPTDRCATYACDRDDDLADVESSSDEETDTFSACSDGSSPPSPAPASGSPSATSTTSGGGQAGSGGSSVGKRLLKVVDKVTTSRYFQQAAQNRYVKRYMEEFSNTPLELTVTLRHLQGVVTLNIPRPPGDRIWYAFRSQPDILLSAQPRLGTRDVTLTQVTDWIENKLLGEMHKVLVLPNMDDLVVPLLAGETLDSFDDVSGAD